MNLKLISITTLVAVAAASQAQVVLTGVSVPNGGNSAFGNSSFATTYSGGVGSVTVNKSTNGIAGAVSGWIYDVQATHGIVDAITFKDVFTAGTVTANSKVEYTISADELASATFKGPTFLSGGHSTALFLNIESQPGWNPLTNTLTFSYDLSSFNINLFKISIDQDFKNVGLAGVVTTPTPEPASIATVGFGLAAIFVRRRRKNA